MDKCDNGDYMFKFLTNLFKTKEEPTFTASIQKVPASQISIDTSGFVYTSGSNVFEAFESVDFEINTIINQGLSGQIDSSTWDSTYLTVQANSAVLWDNTSLSSTILTLELSSEYFTQELTSVNSQLFYVSGNLYSLIDTTSSDLGLHTSTSSIHFTQNDISISSSQIIDFPSNVGYFTNDSGYISSVAWGDITGDLTSIYISSLSSDNITLNNFELTSEIRTLTSVSVTPEYLIVKTNGNERAIRLFEF